PFDWEGEFSEVMVAGGFDMVIGNPPYTLVGSDRPKEQTYFTSGRYSITAYKINTYMLFLEKGLRLLGPTGSILGFIIPKSLVFNTFFEQARLALLSNYAIPQIVEIRERVFASAEVGDSILFFGQKSNYPTRNVLSYYKVKNVFPQFTVLEQVDTLQAELLQNPEVVFCPPAIQIRIQTESLNNIAVVSNGLNPGNVRHILLSASRDTDKHQKMVLGRDIRRYMISWSGTWVNYDPDLKSRIKVTDIRSKRGMTAQKRVDFALRKPEIYDPPKLLVRKTSDHVIASYDPDGFYFDSLAYGVRLRSNVSESVLYILGLLNSRFLGYIHDSLSLNKGKAFAKVLAKNLKTLFLRKQKRFLFISDGSVQTEAISNSLFGAN
ncbi:MAG: Eco57I restriction-modification methylase domain-containing protein, partial [Desulfobacteraceae bacterium]|nr:Eco57I restriction-modification methylase domain-containing protein [Desulfobacteraceae bacterium]